MNNMHFSIINSKLFISVFDNMKHFSEQSKIKIHPNGLHLQSIDDANVSIIDIHFKKEYFEDYNVNKEEIYEQIKDIDGNLIVKEYPTKSASTNTIRSHLSRLVKRGIKPGMIIVDYADLLKPIKFAGEKRHDLENIYEELRGIAQIYDCPPEKIKKIKQNI